MEGGKCKGSMVLSFMVLAMVVVAQAQAISGIHPEAGIGECAKRCGFSCLKELFPPKIAICFGLCMVECKLQPSAAVFRCTSGCANSMLNAYNPTDAAKVESYVGSCYQNCKQQSVN